MEGVQAGVGAKHGDVRDGGKVWTHGFGSKLTKIVAVLVVTSFVITCLQLAVPMYSLQIMDRVISTNSVETLLVLTALTILAIVLAAVLEHLRKYIIRKVDYIFSEISGADVLELGSDAQMFARSPKHEVVDGELTRIRQIRSFVSQHLLNLLDAPFTFLFVLTLFAMHPTLGLVSLLFVGLMSVTLWLSGVGETNRAKGQDASQGKLDSLLWVFKFFDGFIRANYRLITFLKVNINDTRRELEKGRIALQNKKDFFDTALKVIRTSAQVVVTGVSGFLVLNKEVMVGAIIASSILNNKILGSISTLHYAIPSFRVAVRAYRAFVGAVSNVLENRSSLAPRTLKGNVLLDRVVYFYPGQKVPALKGVAMSIECGECVAITGPEMGGKTTLLRMLSGAILPTSGSLRYDDLDAMLIHHCDLSSSFGYISQRKEMILVGNTVRDAICYGDDSVLDSDVHEACELVHANELINALPDGYNTVILNQGLNISESLIRKLCLARCVLYKPKILIMDDCDPVSKYEKKVVMDVILFFKSHGCTCVYATHDAELLDLADRVFTVKNGIAV